MERFLHSTFQESKRILSHHVPPGDNYSLWQEHSLAHITCEDGRKFKIAYSNGSHEQFELNDIPPTVEVVLIIHFIYEKLRF